MVPYDSDADQWPSLRNGHKAHWGVIFGLALMMPYKNEAFDQAKILDGYTSYLKPPLSQKTLDTILAEKEVKYLLMVRQSKSKRIFFFNSRQLAESNNNMTGYSTNHRHHELFMHDGFVMPPGGIKYGLKGQLVFLNKKNSGKNGNATDDENNESNEEDTSTDEEKIESDEEKTSDDGDKSV